MSPSSLPAVMAFYSADASMDQRLASLVGRLWQDGSGADPAAGLSLTWLRYPQSLLPAAASAQPLASRAAASGLETPPQGRGASWQGGWLRDPGELVQLVYLCAAERWLQRDMLEDEPELRRALQAMTRHGSHDATSYVVDRLSGTTSGPSLAPHRREAWLAQRRLVNAWLASLGWPELEGCQALQKTWQEGPYGRERDGFGAGGDHANRFSSDGLARLLEALLAGVLISPPACQQMRGLLELSAAGPLSPSGLTLAALWAQGLPAGGRLWGKGAQSAAGLQLAVYAELPGQEPFLIVLLAETVAADDRRRALTALMTALIDARAEQV